MGDVSLLSRGKGKRTTLLERERGGKGRGGRRAAVVRRATACPEEHPLRGRVCDDGMHVRAWFCKLEDYFNVMSKMKDLVDERTRRGRLKIDQKYRNHSALNARSHLNVAFFCETTTFMSSVDLSSSNRKYKYKTTLSLSRSLLRLTTTAALLGVRAFVLLQVSNDIARNFSVWRRLIR